MFLFLFLFYSSIVIVIIPLHTLSIPLLVSPLIVLTWLTSIPIIPKFPPTPYLYLHQKWGHTSVEKNLPTDFTLNHSHYIFFIYSLSLLLGHYFILFLSHLTYTRISSTPSHSLLMNLLFLWGNWGSWKRVSCLHLCIYSFSFVIKGKLYLFS